MYPNQLYKNWIHGHIVFCELIPALTVLFWLQSPILLCYTVLINFHSLGILVIFSGENLVNAKAKQLSAIVARDKQIVVDNKTKIEKLQIHRLQQIRELHQVNIMCFWWTNVGLTRIQGRAVNPRTFWGWLRRDFKPWTQLVNPRSWNSDY